MKGVAGWRTSAGPARCLRLRARGHRPSTISSNPHLTSFSLVDILSHGRACALMNPYYLVFFAPAIMEPLRLVAEVYRDAGYLQGDPSKMNAKELGTATAEAMFAFAKRINFPTRLTEVKGFTQGHIDLQETLCDTVLAAMLAHPQVVAARVSTRKPDVYDDCDAVGVETFRHKPPRP